MPDSDFHTGHISIQRMAGKDVLVIGDLVRQLTPDEVQRITAQSSERLMQYAWLLREKITDEVWEKMERQA